MDSARAQSAPSTPFFLSVFLAAVTLFYYDDIDPNQRPRITPDGQLRREYDFIIVGAGSAGSVVANRLSEIANWNILLIEAGGDETAFTDAPFLEGYNIMTDVDWNYTTVPQPTTCQARNGKCYWPRGRALGGSSTLNAMFYVRGNPADYDEWESMGNTGWGYNSVLPYFLRSEDIRVDSLRNSPYHNVGGYLSVQYPVYNTQVTDSYLQAGVELGYSITDYTSPNQTGVSRALFTLRGPSRCSTSKAFLRPIRNRTNLHIATRAHATRVIIDQSTMTATGVEVAINGQRVIFNARKDIILSGGTINTAQLLMLSGVGPRDHLEDMNIPVIKELPVGNNLHDHICTSVQFELSENVTITEAEYLNMAAVLQYTRERDGPITTPAGFEGIAFLNTQGPTAQGPPDIQFHFSIFVPSPDSRNVVEIIGLQLEPASRGTIRLASTNPFQMPLIDPNYFGAPGDHEVSLASLQMAVQFMSTSAMQQYSPTFYTGNYPNCANQVTNVTEYLNCLMYQYAFTVFHPVGTCRMGPESDPRTVVSPDLQVHGINRLRVIDASIMPKVTRGNTNAPTIMIAERGSDLVKQYWFQNLTSSTLPTQ